VSTEQQPAQNETTRKTAGAEVTHNSNSTYLEPLPRLKTAPVLDNPYTGSPVSCLD
jgi:hypothetical protein